jgi:RpiR family transcriptional regulator, carbohydrate utilization regulator
VAATAPASNCLDRVRGMLASLTPAGQRVARRILEYPEQVVHEVVGETAEACGVSEATVVRLCQELGYAGFQDLKIWLARDLVRPVELIHEDVQPGDDVATVTRKVFESDREALTSTLAVLDPGQMERAVELVLAATRIEFYGVATSYPIAEDMYHRFLRIGLPCAIHPDSMTQAIAAALSGPGTVAIAVSHTGATKETVDALTRARDAGAATICITTHARSPITKVADVVLLATARETLMRSEAMSSRIAQLCLADALYVNVALRRFDSSLEHIARTDAVVATRRF